MEIKELLEKQDDLTQVLQAVGNIAKSDASIGFVIKTIKDNEIKLKKKPARILQVIAEFANGDISPVDLANKGEYREALVWILGHMQNKLLNS